MQFKEGDRIRYVGNTNRQTMTSANIGKIGTVLRHDHVGVAVHFDGERCEQKGLLEENLEIHDATKAEIDDALKVLAKHGKVAFVPNFKPVVVHFCALGDVIVYRDYAELNGYRIEFDAINKLQAQVQRAGNKLYAD